MACTFWLAECLARQGRVAAARTAFARALATANDLGLFAEEFDPASGTLLGNFPQALTHLSHIAAAVALEQTDGEASQLATKTDSAYRATRTRAAAQCYGGCLSTADP